MQAKKHDKDKDESLLVLSAELVRNKKGEENWMEGEIKKENKQRLDLCCEVSSVTTTVCGCGAYQRQESYK